jgi:6-bladed beta-propeller
VRALLRCALPTLLAAACGDASAGSADAFTVRDSAGISIAESSAPAWAEGEGWRLSGTPAGEIGLAEGAPEYLLSAVTVARRLGDGTIVIANAGTNEIRFYDDDGRHVRSIGGSGSGPGEFQRLAWIHLAARDTILAFDHASRRLSTFSPTGEFVRSITFADDSERRFPDPLGAFDDGSLLVRLGRVFAASEVRSGETRPDVAFARYSAEGTFVDSLAVLPGNETYVHAGDQFITVQPVFFARVAGAAVGDSGTYLGASDSFDIGWYGTDGRLQRLVRRRGELRPVSQAEVDRIREERLASMGDGPWRQAEEEILNLLPARETHPAFVSLQTDDAGNLWVEESRLPWEPPLWTVFDPAGRLLGSLELPDSFRPTHFGEDFVLGVARDELEVNRVRLYDLEKP